MAHGFSRAVELNIIVERYSNWTANTVMESYERRAHPLVSETCFPPC
jgi:hypothetical protein